ncbi:MAG: DUF3810 domain-containing protein [Eubacteriales bacterium]
MKHTTHTHTPYRKLWFLTLVPLGQLLTYGASQNPSWTEIYFSTGFYTHYAQLISMVFSIVPFSVAEFLLVGGVFTIIITLFISMIRAVVSRTIYPLLRYLTHLCVVSSILYFVFVLSCGLNYHRLDFTTYYEGESRDYTTEELVAMCSDYILIAGELRESLTEEDFNQSSYDLSTSAAESFDLLTTIYPILDGHFSEPKPILLSSLMSHTKITGFFFPFTMEANVNVAIPSYQIPFTMLHEQAHQRGFMQENEANFIAFLAGKDSPNPFIQYSAYMSAANYALNSLYSVDYNAFLEAYADLSQLQLADRSDSASYWSQFDDKAISETATSVNDNYLRSNGQENGVASYGEVTQLLLLDYYTQTDSK